MMNQRMKVRQKQRIATPGNPVSLRRGHFLKSKLENIRESMGILNLKKKKKKLIFGLNIFIHRNSTYIHIYSSITIQHMKGSKKKPSDLYRSVSMKTN